MTEVLTTAPADLPITLDQAKEQCRVTNNDDDAHLLSLIEVAVEFAQSRTNRAIYTQTRTKYLDDFPRYGDRTIYLNRRPVASVTSILYLDADGAQQTLATSIYRTDIRAGRITEAYQQDWPTTRQVTNAVEVAYVAGETDIDEIPASIRHALLLIVNAEYDHQPYPQAALDLLSMNQHYVL